MRLVDRSLRFSALDLLHGCLVRGMTCFAVCELSIACFACWTRSSGWFAGRLLEHPGCRLLAYLEDRCRGFAVVLLLVDEDRHGRAMLAAGEDGIHEAGDVVGHVLRGRDDAWYENILGDDLLTICVLPAFGGGHAECALPLVVVDFVAAVVVVVVVVIGVVRRRAPIIARGSSYPLPPLPHSVLLKF